MAASPRLLVSVRSASEALEALIGGASVIDVKEPDHGPLGAAKPSVWRSIVRAVGGRAPISAALGELLEWADRPLPTAAHFEGLSYRKVGLAGLAGTAWASRWAELRNRQPNGPGWIAVAYLDPERAGSPRPDEVLDVALEATDCVGVLFDTWDKDRAERRSITPDWIARVQASRRLAAIGGSLDADRIRDLRSLNPDLFAVRGAACLGGRRAGVVHRDRVRSLIRAIQDEDSSDPAAPRA